MSHATKLPEMHDHYETTLAWHLKSVDEDVSLFKEGVDFRGAGVSRSQIPIKSLCTARDCSGCARWKHLFELQPGRLCAREDPELGELAKIAVTHVCLSTTQVLLDVRRNDELCMTLAGPWFLPGTPNVFGGIYLRPGDTLQLHVRPFTTPVWDVDVFIRLKFGWRARGV